jgi:hypothetical protein
MFWTNIDTDRFICKPIEFAALIFWTLISRTSVCTKNECILLSHKLFRFSIIKVLKYWAATCLFPCVGSFVNCQQKNLNKPHHNNTCACIIQLDQQPYCCRVQEPHPADITDCQCFVHVCNEYGAIYTACMSCNLFVCVWVRLLVVSRKT